MKLFICAFTLFALSAAAQAAIPSTTIECGAYPSFSSKYSATFTSDSHRQVKADIKNSETGDKVSFDCTTPEPCVDEPGMSCGSRGRNDQVIYYCEDSSSKKESSKPSALLIMVGTQLSSELWDFGLDFAQLLCTTKNNP